MDNPTNLVKSVGRGRGRGRRKVITDTDDDDSQTQQPSLPDLSKLLKNLSPRASGSGVEIRQQQASATPTADCTFAAFQSKRGESVGVGRGRGRGRRVTEVAIPVTLESRRHRVVVTSDEGNKISPIFTSTNYWDDAAKVVPAEDESRASSDNSIFDFESGNSRPPTSPVLNRPKFYSAEFRQELDASFFAEEETLMVPLSSYYPKYFNPRPTSKRITRLKASAVQLLQVTDNAGNVVVAFQDDTSVARFQCLLKKMSEFYMTPEGFALKIPDGYLKVGEIVAARVSTFTEEIVFRRVKILSVLQSDSRRGLKAYVIDIDDLTHWYVRSAYALHECFYNHPAQACRLILSNFAELYPKNVFEVMFQGRLDYFRDVMNKLAYRILNSLIGQNLLISNICTVASQSGQEILIGDLDTAANWRIHPYFLEEFYNQFIIKIPNTDNILTKGEIAHVCDNGDISICMETSLSKAIKSILNRPVVIQMAADVTPEGQQELLEKVKTRQCSLFLAHSKDNENLVRVRIRSFYKSKMKGFYMESAKESLLSASELICTLTNNPKVPPILAGIPPQAIQLRLAGVDFIRQKQCEKMIGMQVEFEVIETRNICGEDVHLAVVYNTNLSSESLNQLLKEKSPLLE